jgi:protein SCO1/2
VLNGLAAYRIEAGPYIVLAGAAINDNLEVHVLYQTSDILLVDQSGRSHRFYSDLIAGRIVIIHIIFTGRRSSCPMIMGRLVELQDLLGPLRDDVSILSISADPELDTPQALHAYAESMQAGPGWYFLTGAKDAVEIVLSASAIAHRARRITATSSWSGTTPPGPGSS